MRRLFGTDGVRGVANKDLTPDLALALGRAAGRVLGGPVVVGRDTRVSGPMLEGALVAGLGSAGADVRLAGVLPTPAVAFLALEEKAAAGSVISASHNPVEDNGIKFFSSEGFKIPTSIEDEIEALMQEPHTGLPTGVEVGTVQMVDGALDRYVDHVAATVDAPLDGLTIVLDCAFGAAWRAGPEVFRKAGAQVIAMNDEPDGARINVACGSTDMTRLAERVVSEGAVLGIGFDGDADRALAVDEAGGHVDGDRIIAACALRLLEQGRLKDNIVIGTVMSNLGFIRALESRGVQVIAAPVGDRFVAEEMAARGAVIGGEQSGHVIFGEHSTTGDGILTGLQLAEAVAASRGPLSKLAHWYEPWPQVLINVRVPSKEGLESAEALWDEVRAVEASLGDGGRVLLRPSGTEPVVRVMVEAAEERAARAAAERLAGAVERHLA